jgi:prepilin-type N-terminal cleavage/methylation domain-containing protein
MKKFQQKGFTLVELIIVIIIIVILGAIAVSSFSGETINARNAKRTSDLKEIKKIIETSIVKGYKLETGKSEEIKTNLGLAYPLRGAKLKLIDDKTFSKKITDEAPLDPLKHPYLMAFLNNEVYQIFAIKEDEKDNDKITAYVQGNFKNGLEIDVLAEAARYDETELLVNHPEYFEVGDKITVRDEEMLITEIFPEDKVIEVERNLDESDFLFKNDSITLSKVEKESLVEFEADTDEYKSGPVVNKGGVIIYK